MRPEQDLAKWGKDPLGRRQSTGSQTRMSSSERGSWGESCKILERAPSSLVLAFPKNRKDGGCTLGSELERGFADYTEACKAPSPSGPQC